MILVENSVIWNQKFLNGFNEATELFSSMVFRLCARMLALCGCVNWFKLNCKRDSVSSYLAKDCITASTFFWETCSLSMY
jgi:hypothetical protein